MNTEEMISASVFCTHHNVELTFIQSLNESGLIEIVRVEEELFLPVAQLVHLEKLLHFYYELDINLEGIEAIHHLLTQLETLQQQVVTLNNRIKIYESQLKPSSILDSEEYPASES